MITEPTATAPMHVLGFDQHSLGLVLVAGTVTSGLIVALAIAAFARRPSRAYLLVTLALGTLLLRTLFGVLNVGGVVDATPHHVVEHGLDVVTVVLLFGAVYSARADQPGGEQSV